MAYYYTQMTVQPVFPKGLITEEELRIINLFGIDAYWNNHKDTLFLAAEEYSGTGYDYDEDSDKEYEEDELIGIFQDIIKRSNGEVPWVSFEFSHTCSKMRQDGFGGSATFITADTVDFVCTSCWLREKIEEQETGNDSR